MSTFAKQLRTAMTRRNASRADVAEAVGASVSTVSDWRSGRRSPALASAIELAEYLSWPSLAETVRLDRTRTCPVCQASFTVAAKTPRHGLYCSPRCRSTQTWRTRKGRTTNDSTVTRNRLTVHQEAVASFCRACCPEGVCDRPACELRPVSPLRLALRRSA